MTSLQATHIMSFERERERGGGESGRGGGVGRQTDRGRAGM